MSLHLASLSCMTMDVSGPIKKNKRPSGEIRPAGEQEIHVEAFKTKIRCVMNYQTSSMMNLTSVRISRHRFIFVHQSLDLILPQTWKQLLVEPRVPLFLIEELCEILLSHGGFGGAGEDSEL